MADCVCGHSGGLVCVVAGADDSRIGESAVREGAARGTASWRRVAGRLAGTGGVTGTTLGAVGGTETHTLTTAQMPAHTHANTLSDPGHAHPNSINDPGHTHGHNAAVLTPSSTGGGAFQINGYGGATISAATTGISINNAGAGTGMSINNASQGSGGAHPNVQPTMVLNHIIKV